MKILKQITIVTMVLILILSINGIVKADEITRFSTNDVSGKLGDEITVKISLDTDSNFVSADLNVEYDPRELEYINYENDTLLKNSAMNIVKNNSNTGKVAIGYVGTPTTGEVKISSGDIVNIKFRIISDENEELKFKLNCTSLKDNAGNNINYNVKQGKITIQNNSEPRENNTVTNNTVENNTITNNTISNNAIANNTVSNNTIANNAVANNTVANNIKDKNNNINNNTSTNNNVQNTDNKTNTALPKTGSEQKQLGIISLVVCVFGLIFYKKFRDLDGI